MMNIFWNFCAFFTRLLLRLRYSIEVKGLAEVKQKLKGKEKSTLFLPNHVASVEPMMMMSLLWKKFQPRPLMFHELYEAFGLHFVGQVTRSLPVPNFERGSNSYKKKQWEKVLHEVACSLERGDNFLIYPSGRLKRSAKENLLGASGVYQILNDADRLNIVLVRITGLWGSMFSCALTGQSPPLMKTFFQGLKVLLKNLIFFTPRRKVTIEFELFSKQEFENLTHVELNSTLSNWYNKPFVQSKGSEPLNLVSYTFWKKTLPKVPEHTDDQVFDLSKVDPKITEKVKEYLAHLTEKNVEEIHVEDQIGADLGLDSLEIAQLITFIEQHFSIRNISPEEMTTVGAVIYFAAGLKKHVDWIHTSKSLLFKWRWYLHHRADVKILPGQTILECFLQKAHQCPHTAICVDEMRSSLLTYQKFVVGAIALSKRIEKMPHEHIGILLPSSAACFVTILACYLAKKVPVMLNWTQGRMHIEQACTLMDIDVILTSSNFMDAVSNADFGVVDEKFVFLEDLKKKISLLQKIQALKLSRKKASVILKAFNIEPDAKTLATVLFTSGTEGPPKAVGLTHENILENQKAGLNRVKIEKGDILYSILPPFHSFGFSVAGFMPLLCGVPVVFNPNPLDSANLAYGIGKWGITLLCGAPSFLQPILQLAKKEEIRSLKWVISGAESPSELLLNRVQELGLKFAEGYGITECSPIVTIQNPDEERKGVGKALDNVELLIVDEESMEKKKPKEVGLILIRGVSVFSGYLSKAENPFVEVDGKQWYNSKDVGYLDEEGNLHLTGRRKRIVKIGGEMISLTFLEQSLTSYGQKNSWDLQQGAPSFAIVPVGEDSRVRLTLYSSIRLQLRQVNDAIRAMGFPNIVKIHALEKVDYIPLTGTGKIDYRNLEGRRQ